MKTYKVITNFSGFREANLGTLGNTIVTSMTGNAYFQDLSPDVLLCANAHTEYMVALANAPVGGPQAKSIKARKRETLLARLHNLAVKVNLDANGDKVMLDTTGIPFVKDRTSSKDGPLDKVEGLTLGQGPAVGSMAVGIDRVEGATAYVYQYTEGEATASSVWNFIHTNELSVVIYGLKRGGHYSVRAAGIGRDTTLVFSDVADIYIQ